MDILNFDYEEENNSNLLEGLLEIVTQDYLRHIQQLAYDFVKKAFEKGEIVSTYGKIKEFPPYYECVIGFKNYAGGFLYQCRETGDYILISFEKKDAISFLSEALTKGDNNV